MQRLHDLGSPVQQDDVEHPYSPPSLDLIYFCVNLNDGEYSPQYIERSLALGSGLTPQAFRQRFPWVAGVIRKARAEVRERQKRRAERGTPAA
jgi:hypothetical protein